MKEASKLLGVTVRTIQRWDKEGKIRCVRTVGGKKSPRNRDKEDFGNSGREESYRICKSVIARSERRSGEAD